MKQPKSQHAERRLLSAVISIVFAFSASLGLADGHSADPRLVVLVEGFAAGYPSTVPDIDNDGQDDFAFCFDVNLTSAKTNKVIGTATECVSDLDGDGPMPPYATTTFNFPQGTLVARGKMNFGLVSWDPATNSDVADINVLSGYFPAPGANNILSGTGRFKNATGRVRLSGAVIDNFDGTATLDCMFIIDLY